MDWLIDHWGDLASAIGLLVAVVGFSVAVVQIRRTRRAAEAAEQAVIATRDVLARNLTIADLVRASERIEEVKRLHRERQWQRALDRYHDMRVMLSDVRSRHPRLSDAQQSSIQQSIDQLATIERAVARALTSGNEPTNPQRYDDFLMVAQSMLDRLASDLQQAVSNEVSNG